MAHLEDPEVTSLPPRQKESRISNSSVIHDFIIGFADGLTVPFALTAGLTSLGSTRLVIIGGLAELVSGCISMGLGAYLASVSDRQHYAVEERRERDKIAEKPVKEENEIVQILTQYGISETCAKAVAIELQGEPEGWTKFMMDFQLKLEKPDRWGALISALTMGMAYFFGGIIPLIPYFAIPDVNHALFVSIGITVVILLLFGYGRSRAIKLSHKASAYGALQTLAIGAVAAGASYGIVKAIEGSRSF